MMGAALRVLPCQMTVRCRLVCQVALPVSGVASPARAPKTQGQTYANIHQAGSTADCAEPPGALASYDTRRMNEEYNLQLAYD